MNMHWILIIVLSGKALETATFDTEQACIDALRITMLLDSDIKGVCMPTSVYGE